MAKIARQIVVVDFAPSNYATLARFGCPHNGDDSWSARTRRISGFPGLVRECGLAISENVSVTEVELSLDPNAANLDECFRGFGKELGRVICESDKEGVCVVANFMSFCLSVTRVDKIFRGLIETAGDWEKSPLVSWVMLVRNVDWLTKSIVFMSDFANRKATVEFAAVDVRRYGLLITTGAATIQPRTWDSRRPFRRVLNVEQRLIYDSLIKNTNVYLGHFELPHSHVRTHYDLSFFVQKDRVWEFLVEKLEQLIDLRSSLLVLGVGIERNAIDSLGTHLASTYGQETEIHYEYVGRPDLAPDLIATLQQSYDRLLVVSDILNTGETVRRLIKSVSPARFSAATSSVFAIARMRNARIDFEVSRVEVGLEIKRDYYIKGACRLCDIGQPCEPVRTIEDFRKVLPSQLTPYDFWEMVTDAKALIKDEVDLQGRPFSYRIDTAKIIDRYSYWLENIIRAKRDRESPAGKPTIICTVAEPGGRKFAALVSRALGRIPVVEIPRQVLERVTVSGGPPEGGPVLDPQAKVLVVDDGMNRGNTMRKLILYCEASKASMVGGVVFDSRLTGERMNWIKNHVFGGLTVLYDWANDLHEN